MKSTADAMQAKNSGTEAEVKRDPIRNDANNNENNAANNSVHEDHVKNNQDEGQRRASFMDNLRG